MRLDLVQFIVKLASFGELNNSHTGILVDAMKEHIAEGKRAGLSFDESSDDWNNTMAAIVTHFKLEGPNAKNRQNRSSP